MAGLGTQIEECLDSNTRDYLDSTSMSSSDVWATDAELMATASTLGTDVYVYCRNGTTGLTGSLCLSKTTQHAIYLQNISGDHFDIVIGVE